MSKRSRGSCGDECRDGRAEVGGGADSGEVVEGGALLLAAGGRDTQEPFDEAVPGVAPGAEGLFTPQDGGTQGALGGVVGWFDAGNGDEGPQGRPQVEERTTQPGGLGTRVLPSARQQRLERLLDGLHGLG
jgi:hypothetical protein